MENFSTSRVALLPRAANLATLAVVVAATWWSGAQRPVDQAAIAATSTTTETTPHSAATSATLSQQQPAELSAINDTANAAHWPRQTTVLAREGLQAVGFQPRTQR